MDELAARHVLLDLELIALLTLVLGVGIYGLVRRLRQKEDLSARADYDGFDFVLMFFPALMFLIGPVVTALFPQGSGGESTGEPVDEIVVALVNIGYFLFVGIMTYGIIEWVRDRRVSDLFGLKRLDPARVIVISIFGGVASLLICAGAVGEYSNTFLDSIFTKLEAQDPVKMFQESSSPLHLGLSIVVACVAAPLAEEFLFRGYMYGTVRKLTHPIFAAIVIGALFAVAHGNLPAFLPLWVFSILLCLAYEITGCLWVPVGMHVFFNLANIVLMFLPEQME
jgi:membrane protease YdiL (CAAX protease family)